MYLFSSHTDTDSFFFYEFEVKLLCHLHHDQLKPVFHVSQRIRKAVSLSLSASSSFCFFFYNLRIHDLTSSYYWQQVILARQYHFNYTTPDRSRQEMLRTMTPHPTEHWPFKRLAFLVFFW